MQSSFAGQLQQRNDIRMKKLLEEAATSLVDTSEVLGRQLGEARRELAATKSSNTVLEGKLGSAERQITILEEALRQKEVESRAEDENGVASAEQMAALRKRLEREKAAAVQEVEAKWQERHDNFKRESVAVLAHSASSLEAAEEEIKQLKEIVAAAEAGVLEEQQRVDKLTRDHAQSHTQGQEDQEATAAQRDAALQELEALKETLKREVTDLRESYERDQREAQAQVAAAEAESAKLHAALATERQHAERAQQEAKLLAAQLEQNRGRLTMALAARDRADAECAAAKAERVAAERDREAAEKVLADVVVQLDELERQQEEPPPLPEPHAQALLMAPHDAANGDPGNWDDEEQPPHAAEAAAQPPRFSRDPRLSAGALVPANGGGAVDDSYTSALPDLSDQGDAAGGAVESPAQEEQLPTLMTVPGTSAGGPQGAAEATCWLCQKGGSRQFRDLGPLMHLAINGKGTEMKWLHRQCLLWSPEVSEGRGSDLVNVPKAVFRGRHINCKVCGKNGATLGCQVKQCRNSYHLPCALAKGCYLDDWRVWCPKHAPHIPSRVAAGPFSGLDLDSLRQSIANGNDEASGKEGASKSRSAPDPDAPPVAAKRAASGPAARRKASSQPSSASAATIEAPLKPAAASAPAAKKARSEQAPLRKAASQPAQSAAAPAETPEDMPAAAAKQHVSAPAARGKAASQQAVSTAATTGEAPASAPAARRQPEPHVSPRRQADSQSASVSAAARSAADPQHKVASQPSDVAMEDNSVSEQDVEAAEAAPEAADAAPAPAEVAPVMEAEGTEPAAIALQPARRKKRKGIPVAAQPSMPGVPARLPPITTPTKIRKVRRRLKAKSKAKPQPAKQPAEQPMVQAATQPEPDLAPSSEPAQVVGNNSLHAPGDAADQAVAAEEPEQAMDEEPDEAAVEVPDLAMDEEADEAAVEVADQAMDEEPDEEAPASHPEPEPEQNSQVVSALGRSTGAIASMLGLQRWSRLAPKAAKQTAVLLAARGRLDGSSSHGAASASSAPAAAAPSSSAAALTSSAGAPSASAAEPTTLIAPPASPGADRSGFVGRLLDCLAEQEANPGVSLSVHPYQRKEAKRLEWGSSSPVPPLPPTTRRPKSAEANLPRSEAPKPLPLLPKEPLAPAAGAKKAAAAGKPPASAAAGLLKLAADGRTGGIVRGVPVAGTGALVKKRGRPKKVPASVPAAAPDAPGLAAGSRGPAAPLTGTGALAKKKGRPNKVPASVPAAAAAAADAGPAAEARAAVALLTGTGALAKKIGRPKKAPASAPAAANASPAPGALAAAAAPQNGTGALAKKKGRPKKAAAGVPAADAGPAAEARAAAAPLNGTGAPAKKIGRPRKVPASVAVAAADAAPAAEAPAAAAPQTGGPASDVPARAAPHSAPAAAGGGKKRPERNRKAPERLASMPEGPQWLGTKGGPGRSAAHQAPMANGFKSEAAQGEARGQKRPAPAEVSEAAEQNTQADGEQARPAKKACNEPVGSPGISRELRALQSAAAGLKALSSGKQSFRYTTRLASSSPEPQQPSSPVAAAPKPAKHGRTMIPSTPSGGGDHGSSSDAAAYDTKAELLHDLMTRRRPSLRMHPVGLRRDSDVLALSADEVAAIVQRMRIQATLP